MAYGTVNVPSGLELDSETLRKQILQELNSEAVQEQIAQAAGAAVSTSRFYTAFDEDEWVENELRIPKTVHGIEPPGPACMATIYQYLGRTAARFIKDAVADGKEAIVNAVKAALAANKSKPGVYPTHDEGSGHIVLTWEQVQYYILESELLPADEAEAKAGEKGLTAWKPAGDDWTIAEALLEGVLAAAYIPALGGAPTWFDRLCTLEVLRKMGLRRRSAGAAETVEVYDPDGAPTQTWGTHTTQARWDMDTKELVLRAKAPFDGEVLVLETGAAASSGGGMAKDDYERLLASIKRLDEALAVSQAQTAAELKKKGDKLDYDGETLSLMSGESQLSSVTVEGGDVGFATDEEFDQMLHRVYGPDE